MGYSPWWERRFCRIDIDQRGLFICALFPCRVYGQLSPTPTFSTHRSLYWGAGDIWKYVFYLHGPIARYVKLRVAHAPGMPGTFCPPPPVSDPDMHHGTCVTHVPWCMPGSLTSGFVWNWWRRKRFRHSRRMRNPQFYVSGKRLMQTGNIRVV